MTKHNIANYSVTTEGREKISADLELFEFKENFDAYWSKFKNKKKFLFKLATDFY
jgi:hypothetical protein